MGETMQLRVVTFNIRNGRAWDGLESWPFRRRATAATVARLDADLIALQEVYGFQQRYLLRRLHRLCPSHRYASAGVGRNDGGRRGERCSVLFQPPFALEREQTRWFSDTPDRPGSRSWESGQPRIVTLARFRHAASGRRFGVANLHLEGASSHSRERSAEALLEWLEPGLPWIVAGDLNATPDEPAVRKLLAGGLRDALLEAGPEPGPTERSDGKRIDYLLVSEEWQVRAAAVRREAPDRRRPSDHWPVVADLTLP